MKKNGKPKAPRNNGSGEAAENLRNRKTYLNRLEEMGLDEPPAIKRGKMPSAIELARVAAALAKDSTSEVGDGGEPQAKAGGPSGVCAGQGGGTRSGGVGFEVRHSRSSYAHRSLDAVDGATRGREVR